MKEKRFKMLKRLTVSDGSSSKPKSNLRISGVGAFLFALIFIIAIASVVIMDGYGVPETISVWFLIILIIIATILLFAAQVASQWEKAVVLRFGKFQYLKGPGMFWLIPIVDTVVNWIDHRVNVTPFSAEKTLTKDAP
jgi:regulator of protease activity HflC (stomatin/prohibitin superfamily)